MKTYCLLKNNESRDLTEEINSIEVSLLTATWTNWEKKKSSESKKRF